MRARLWTMASFGAAAALFAGASLSRAEPAQYCAARFDVAGHLLFPADYRHWTYLSSGVGMSYNPVATVQVNPPFTSVFVDPGSEAVFRKTAHWPDGAVLVLEVRGASSRGSINLHGSYQSGAPLAVEIHVHDSKRFKGGWGFFSVDAKQVTTLIPYTADCYSCHLQHAAVDTTFVQFYPTLLPVAQAKRTFSAAYLAEEAARKP